MHYVYIIKSFIDGEHWYVGSAIDVVRRLEDHNLGECVHTSKYRPWSLHLFIGFENKYKALAFEKYLKSGSGRAFSKKHF
ncbi:GIY-YIG nuclease family protein [Candidatus Dependentiae bacterium]|nr:GIY-YIG nuclease family protein [Candidatus Dependentiae bacterium]